MRRSILALTLSLMLILAAGLIIGQGCTQKDSNKSTNAVISSSLHAQVPQIADPFYGIGINGHMDVNGQWTPGFGFYYPDGDSACCWWTQTAAQQVATTTEQSWYGNALKIRYDLRQDGTPPQIVGVVPIDMLR